MMRPMIEGRGTQALSAEGFEGEMAAFGERLQQHQLQSAQHAGEFRQAQRLGLLNGANEEREDRLVQTVVGGGEHRLGKHDAAGQGFAAGRARDGEFRKDFGGVLQILNIGANQAKVIVEPFEVFGGFRSAKPVQVVFEL